MRSPDICDRQMVTDHAALATTPRVERSVGTAGVPPAVPCCSGCLHRRRIARLFVFLVEGYKHLPPHPRNVEPVCGDTVLARTNAPRDLRDGGRPRHDEPSQLGEISVLDEAGRRLVLVVGDDVLAESAREADPCRLLFR